MRPTHDFLTDVLRVRCATLFLLLASATGAAQCPSWGCANPAMLEPEIFGPGTISTGMWEGANFFTPDGKYFYFVRISPNFQLFTTLISQYRDGRWQSPEIASYSGRYSDADSSISPDGTEIYFISTKPAAGSRWDELNYDIYVIDHAVNGQARTRWLDEPLNSAAEDIWPLMTANGNLYFSSNRDGGYDLYVSKQGHDGRFFVPKKLSAQINTGATDYDSYVAPDESFILFTSAGRADSLGSSDLYFSCKSGGLWSEARNLGRPVNSSASDGGPFVTADGEFLYFSSKRGLGEDRRLERPLAGIADLNARLRGPMNGMGSIFYVSMEALAHQFEGCDKSPPNRRSPTDG